MHQQNQTPQQNFLDEFTLEIILSLVKKNLEEKKFRIEEESSKKNIESEKLKIKFGSYLQKKSLPRNDNLQKQIIQNIQIAQTILKPGEQQKPAIEKVLVLLADKEITYVECRSEKENLLIKKRGQVIRTEIILSKEEVIEVIRYFSEKARIPLIEGILLAKIENIEISAVVSETTRSSFIIKKILPTIQISPPQRTPAMIFSQKIRQPSQFRTQEKREVYLPSQNLK